MNLRRFAYLLCVSTALVAVGPMSVGSAQTLSDKIAKKSQAKQDDRMLVEARELIYDRDKNTVTALGDVQIYYQGKVMEADKVVYDRTTERVFATGNARLREPTGQMVYGDTLDMTSDFKNGFINALRLEQKDKSRFASPRAERTEGESTVFENGTYTACDACKDDPAKPPLWQVRAQRIIHNNEERTIYYENAKLDIAGYPILWVPYMSAPDATVKRKSGFLPPRYFGTNRLGTGAMIPYFWNLAPNYDLTLAPAYLSRQGLLGRAEWRHRLEYGSYNIRIAGINQADKSAWLVSPNGAGDRDLRGSFESTGKFLLNEKWAWGWDVALLSDKWFLQNYRVRSESLQAFTLTPLQSATSTLYLRGEGDRSFFDARGYYFKTLSAADWQKQQPIVLPVVDYDRRFETPWSIGGETRLTANVTSLTREEADYKSLYKQVNGVNVPGNYIENGHETCLPGQYALGRCYVRGIAGSYSRVTTELAWRRGFIDPIGQSWTPFASVRADMSYATLDTSAPYNIYQPNFLTSEHDPLARSMAMAGMTYRYPFVARQWGASHIVEPIGQLILRPSETRIGAIPNEDSQSLVFDDTTLFDVNKFSGYDRVEGGVRANVGAQYTLTLDSGAFANALFGQSYHLAGVNSFSNGGLSQTGPQSGLDKDASDYVGRVLLAPSRNYSLSARGRFDETDWSMKRLEVQASANYGPISTSVSYGRYAAQPALGYNTRREGLSASARYNISTQYYVFGGAALDLTRGLSEMEAFGTSSSKSNSVAVSGMNVGAGYKDECTLFEVMYSRSASNPLTGSLQPVKALMFRLELRTLGATAFTQKLSSSTEQQ